MQRNKKKIKMQKVKKITENMNVQVKRNSNINKAPAEAALALLNVPFSSIFCKALSAILLQNPSLRIPKSLKSSPELTRKSEILGAESPIIAVLSENLAANA